jgi:hypothetical protein
VAFLITGASRGFGRAIAKVVAAASQRHFSKVHIILVARSDSGLQETKDLILAASNPLILGSYATIAILWGASQVILIPYYVHLLLLVTAILYVACHQSLTLRENIPKEGEEGYDPDVVAPEMLKQEDAYQFPLFGSLSLLSLYLAFKFLGQDFVNLMIGGYFGMVGCGALTVTLAPVIAKLTPKSFSQKELGWKKKYHIHFQPPCWKVRWI